MTTHIQIPPRVYGISNSPQRDRIITLETFLNL